MFKLFTPQHQEESWDDGLELEAKRDELDSEFGRRDEEDRTISPRSRCAALSRFASAISSPPPMLFFPINIQLSSPEPVPRSPTANVFSVPNTSYTYSSSTALVYGSHPRPNSVTPFAPHTQRAREEAVKEEEPSASRGDEGVCMAVQYSFSDGEGHYTGSLSTFSEAFRCVIIKKKNSPTLTNPLLFHLWSFS